MSQILITLFVVFLISKSIAIEESDVKPWTLVRFHWSQEDQQKRLNPETRRRAMTLNGQLAEIMNPARWRKDESKVAIQSVDHDHRDVTLAVKPEDLELVEPIKIHVFHAKNDSLLSDEYLRKEMEIGHSSNYSVAMTIHPQSRSSPWYIGNGIDYDGPIWDDLLLNELIELSGYGLQSDYHRFDWNIVEHFKNTTRNAISRLLLERYEDGNGSDALSTEELSGYDPVFRTTLLCQLGKIAQNNGNYVDMEWWTNDKMTMEWMAQGMHLFYDGYHQHLNRRAEELMKTSMAPIIRRVVFETISPIIEHDNNQFLICTRRMEDRLRRIVFIHGPELVAQPSLRWQQFIRELGMIPRFIAQFIRSDFEHSILCNIGQKFSRIAADVDCGVSIAIVLPGNLIPNADRLDKFIYRMIKKLGWKYKCELEVFEI